MSERDALLRHIIDHPDDDAPRLVFADWLDEHGEPERAEFIRLQCTLATLPDGDMRRPGMQRRAELLLDTNARHWESFLTGLVTIRPTLQYQRGFAESVTCVSGQIGRLAAIAPALFAHEPVRSLVLSGSLSARAARTLARLPELDRIRTLDCTLDGRDSDNFAHLLTKARWAGLREFRFDSGEGILNVVPILARCVHITGLQRLMIEPNNFLEATAVATLAGLPHLANLRELSLSWNNSEPGSPLAGLRSIRASPHWTRLTHLDIAGVSFGDAGLTALLAWPHLPSLRSLNIAGTLLTNDGAVALAGSPAVARLVSLNLYSNYGITATGVRAILASPHLAGLRTLRLPFVSDDEVRRVAETRFGKSVWEPSVPSP